MKNYDRVMVAVDLSSADKSLLKYTRLLHQLFTFKQIDFIHIIPNMAIEIQGPQPSEFSLIKRVQEKIQEDVQKAFKDFPDLALQVQVLEGKPYEKLIHWSDTNEIALLLVGRKNRSEYSGITARRVARKTKADVVFVPENPSLKIKKIICPVDLSEHSNRALKKALSIQQNVPEVGVTALNIVHRPLADYHSPNWEDPGPTSRLVENVKTAYQEFLEEYQLKDAAINPVFIDDQSQGVARVIERYLQEQSPDLVVLGAKGHSPFEVFLFGSITEVLLENFQEAPILVVR